MLVDEQLKQKLIKERNDYFEIFQKWWNKARKELLEWSLDDYFKIVEKAKALRPGDRQFFNKMVGQINKFQSAKDIFSDKETRELIRLREIKKRPTKGRLKYIKYC